MTNITPRAVIERLAREAADRGDSLAESTPYPPESEQARVFADAFRRAREDVA